MAKYGESYWQRWKDYQPSKVLWFWSCVAVLIATVIVGFKYGGWVTGGTAQFMSQEAAADARAQLVADVCVERYVNGDSFNTRLAELKEASAWGREDIIAEGNWTDMPGMTEPVENAADLCAEKLAEMEATQEPAGDSSMPQDGAAS